MNLAFPSAFLPRAFSGCVIHCVIRQCYSFCVHYGFPDAFPWDTQKDERLWVHFGEQRISLPFSFQDWPKIICIDTEYCPVGIFMILKKTNQLLQSLCIRREDLERFAEKLELKISWTLTCAPPSTYISINRVWKPYYKYLNMHLSQADAWAKQTWWQLLGSLAKI